MVVDDVIRAERFEMFQCYINGTWCDSISGEHRIATNPATGEAIAEYPDGTREDVWRAIDAARSAQLILERMSPFERANLCHEVADAIEDRHDELVDWIVADQGKPVADAEYEVGGAVDLFRIAAEDAKRIESPTVPSQNRNKRVVTMRKPHGVLGIITPWNFPLTIPVEYVAPGLVIGNAIVWMPAPTTSVVGIKLMEIIAETSVPDGALNLVTGDGPVVGNEVASNNGINAVGFTGSPVRKSHKLRGRNPLY